MKKKNIWWVVGAVAVVAGLALIFLSNYLEQKTTGPVVMNTSEAPWATDATTLKARLVSISLPALSAEGTALHIHQHLDIFVHGKKVSVPLNIGVHEGVPSFISPIHTHDTSGIVHVESPTVETFYLGQFFDIWGVRLSNDCIGGYCADATNTLMAYVNGIKYSGDLRTLELASHEEIVLEFGTQAEAPTSTPSTYSFPEGY